MPIAVEGSAAAPLPKAGLLLVEIDRKQFEADRRNLLQIAQGFEHVV
jgi:hypothetical protein